MIGPSPLALTHDTAFHLKGAAEMHELLNARTGSLDFARSIGLRHALRWASVQVDGGRVRYVHNGNGDQVTRARSGDLLTLGCMWPVVLDE